MVNLYNNVDEFIGKIRNAKNNSCSEEEPMKNKVIIPSEVLHLLELNTENPDLRNPTQITGTLPSPKSKIHRQINEGIH